MDKILKRIEMGDGSRQDLDLLLSVCDNIEGNPICALGDAAAWHVRGFIKKFRNEFESRVQDKRSFKALNVVHGKRESADSLIFENN
jgi:NADH-quinone oxidoreductase subunit F